jgi:hypothetical protein
VFDLWGKIQSGLGTGNRFNFGHFTGCLSFRHESNDQNVGEIRGQHCLVSFVGAENDSLPEVPDRFDWKEM